MKTSKIILGQADSAFARLLGDPTLIRAFEVLIADRGNRIFDMIRSDGPPAAIIIESSLQDPDPAQVCRDLKADPDLSTVPVLLIALQAAPAEQLRAMEAGFDDVLTEAMDGPAFEARLEALVKLRLLSDEDDAQTVLYTLARTIEAKDPYTRGHADRVAQFATSLGAALGLPARDIETLRQGGMLHDIGKIAIPDAILFKPGRYSPEEFSIMQRHPVLGCEICQKLKSVKDALPLIRHHHERLDGSGYPDRLAGDAISPLVRIVTIVDIYDALRSRRSYKEAFTLEKSFQIMWEEADKGWWDKSLLALWEKVVRSSPNHSYPIG